LIDAVISDKAEERRFLFEEAAGITKYKQRRKAATRKLEATENDFLRLKDIYSEVKTRVNALYRQHKKAERYKELSDRIKGWELYLAGTRLRRLENEKRELKAQFDRLSDQKEGRGTALDVASSELEADRKELLELEQELSRLGNEIYGITEKAHRLENEISVLREKKSNAAQLIERNRADVIQLDGRRNEIAAQVTEAEAELTERTAELEALEAQLAEAQAAHAEADRKLLAARLRRESENQRLVSLEGKLSSGMTEESALREQTTDLENDHAELERAIREHRPRQTELIKEIEHRRDVLNGLLAGKAELEARRRDTARAIEEKIEASARLSQELAEYNASIEACEARRQLLQEMMLQYEGFEAGVVAAMDERQRWPEVEGTVADLFVPVDEMERVLEAALGEMSKFLICRTRRAAEQVIAYLREGNFGKVGILVPQSGTLSAAIKRPDLNLPGVVGWLDNYVSTEESLRTLKEAVLATTLVFQTGADIDGILEHLPYGFGAVSTDGVLYRKNLIAGGSSDEIPLFRRREKVAEQDNQISELRARASRAEDAARRVTLELAALRSESSHTAEQLDSLAEEIERAQKELGEIEFQSRTLSAEFVRWEKEKQNLAAKIENIRGRQYSLGLGSTQLADEKERLLAAIRMSAEQLQTIEGEANRVTAAVSRLQVATIEAKSRREQTESRIRHARELLDEMSRTRDQKTSEIAQAEEDIRNADETLVTREVDLKACFVERDKFGADQGTLREEQALLLERVSGRERRVKELRQERESVSEELHKADVRLNTITSEVAGLIEKMLDEHEVDISQAEITRPVEDTSDEDAPRQLAQLKESLKAFGAVNLLAMEEYDVASERERFLGEQLSDLTRAKNDLKTTITKINQTARSLFNETFAKVQDNFSKLFVELFAGGEASIRLIDPDDPLESDIEIIARPGGKKLLPITVLSGGERALTAISLLFALYLVKPSPFCILDEIDAPLDDANCRRFLKIIHAFSRQTQFITITHNKITMEAAHNLYGITMEQPGVSKLVSVRFTADANGNGSGDEPAALDIVDAGSLMGLPDAVRERLEQGVTVRDEKQE